MTCTCFISNYELITLQHPQTLSHKKQYLVSLTSLLIIATCSGRILFVKRCFQFFIYWINIEMNGLLWYPSIYQKYSMFVQTMMGCKRNYSSSGDLCQNAKSLYRTLFLHTLRIAVLGDTTNRRAICVHVCNTYVCT